MKTLIPISDNEAIVSFNDDPCACLIPCGHITFYTGFGHNFQMTSDLLDDVPIYCDIPVGHVSAIGDY